MRKKEFTELDNTELDERFIPPLFFIVKDNFLTNILTPLGEEISKIGAMKFLVNTFTKIPNPEKPSRYITFAIANAFLWSLMISFAFFLLLCFYSVNELGGIDAFLNIFPAYWFGVLSLVLLATFTATFTNFIIYPKVIIEKADESVRENALRAVQYFIIQIESGIPVIESMKNIAIGGYGEISKSFEKVIEKINGIECDKTDGDKKTGKTGIEAIRETIEEMESKLMKRILKQIIIAKDQKIGIRETLKGTIFQIKKERINAANSSKIQIIMTIFLFVLMGAAPGIFILSSAINLSTTTNLFTTNLFTILPFFLLIILFQIILIGYAKSVRPKVR